VSAFNLFQISVHLIEAIKILNVSVANTEIIPEKSSQFIGKNRPFKRNRKNLPSLSLLRRVCSTIEWSFAYWSIFFLRFHPKPQKGVVFLAGKLSSTFFLHISRKRYEVNNIVVKVFKYKSYLSQENINIILGASF
jgi:hypothetical protein